MVNDQKHTRGLQKKCFRNLFGQANVAAGRT
jgi:hypothetical protein